MSSRPLNGEMVTVRPTGRTGRLLVKLPSTHLCGENGPSYGHEFEQALGIGDGQESLMCYSPQGHKESDKTEWLN